jgi:hypothetical protein
MKQRIPGRVGSPYWLVSLFALMMAATVRAQTPQPAPLALMPLPTSVARGEGALIVTPAGGGASTFTYNFGQTHDARLEAAVRRAVIRLGRTCGGEVLRSTIDHPTPAQASLLITVATTGAPV